MDIIRSKKVTITLRCDEFFRDDVKHLANKKGLKVATYIKMILKEKINKERIDNNG